MNIGDTGPLFPEGPAGAALYALINAEPEPGPPYTHTFRPPPTEYDEDGEPIWKPMEPTFTITAADVADMIDRDERAFMLGLCPQGHLRRARTRTGTFGETVTTAYCPSCEGCGGD